MSIRIGLGTGMIPPLAVEDYWAWAQLCEAQGIDSIWHSDLIVRPSFEPMTMMAALAAATKRLRFGTNVVVVAHRDPLLLARECATIEYLAPGRFLPAFGVGDKLDPTWAATARDPAGRGPRGNEAIELVRRLLSEERVSFEGKYFSYKDAGIAPRPAKPPPIWIGGDSPAAIQRTAALGDGWLGSLMAPESAAEVIAKIKAALTETGRRIDDDHYGVVIPFRLGGADDPQIAWFQNNFNARGGDFAGRPRPAAVGGAEAAVEVFRRFVDVGVSKFVALPLSSDAADLMAQTRRLADEVLPQVEG